MTLDTSQIISMTEANQNFSKVVKIADKQGTAVVFKNNRPKYMIVNLETNPVFELTDDERIDVAARRILEKYRPAFKKLAE